MRNTKLTLIGKLRILKETIENGKIRETAMKYEIFLAQNRNWRFNYSKPKSKLKKFLRNQHYIQLMLLKILSLKRNSKN